MGGHHLSFTKIIKVSLKFSFIYTIIIFEINTEHIILGIAGKRISGAKPPFIIQMYVNGCGFQ